MFWAWTKNRFTESAVAFFNSINNNNSGGNSAGAIGKSGYNKLDNGGAGKLPKDTVSNEKNQMVNQCIKDEDTTEESSSGSDYDMDGYDDLSGDSDEYEDLTCSVCDKRYNSPQLLFQHQKKKRHFGCAACESLFQSMMALEHHKEEQDDWSGDESAPANLHCSDNSSEGDSEDMERLL